MEYLSFCGKLISLSIMSSRFIHVVIYGGISIFLCVNNVPLHCIFHPSSHVWMWELDHKEGRASKNGCFWTVVQEKTLKSPLNCKIIKLVKPKGNQPWIFIGRTDAEAPIIWPPDAKSVLTRKDSDAGKVWRQEKGMTEDEMVGWHHRLNKHEFEQTLGDSEGHGSLVGCSPWVTRSWIRVSDWKARLFGSG